MPAAGGHYVLILAAPEDRLAQRTRAGLQRRGVPVLWLEPQALAQSAGLTWSVESGTGFLDLDACRPGFDELRSVLARQDSDPLPKPEQGRDGDRSYVAHEVRATLAGWLDSLPCPVVNRPQPGIARSALLDRADVIARSGLTLTPALVTSDQNAGLSFFGEVCHGRALLASATREEEPFPLSAGPEGAAELLGRIERGPVVLRALPDGDRVAVFVLGQVTIAGCPDAAGGWSPVKVPGALRDACRRLCGELKLSLARVELVLEGDQASCLEVTDFPRARGLSAELETELEMALCALLAGARPA